MSNKDFGAALVRIRKAKGLTQIEVAEMCHLNMRTVQRIESGEVTPRDATIRLLSDALGMDYFESRHDYRQESQKSFFASLIEVTNLKTNTMKKVSILTIVVVSVVLVSGYVFKTEAQTPTKVNAVGLVTTKKVPPSFFAERFDEFKIDGHLVWVRKGNKKGLWNTSGKEIIPCDFDALEVDDGLVGVYKGRRMGVFDLEGNVIVPCEFEHLEVDDGYVAVYKKGKMGLWDLEGHMIIPCKYDKFKVDSGLVAVFNRNQIGVMDFDGKTIVPCRFETVEINGGYAWVTKNNKVGLWSLEGKEVLACRYDNIRLDGAMALVEKKGKISKIAL